MDRLGLGYRSHAQTQLPRLVYFSIPHGSGASTTARGPGRDLNAAQPALQTRTRSTLACCRSWPRSAGHSASAPVHMAQAAAVLGQMTTGFPGRPPHSGNVPDCWPDRSRTRRSPEIHGAVPFWSIRVDDGGLPHLRSVSDLTEVRMPDEFDKKGRIMNDSFRIHYGGGCGGACLRHRILFPTGAWTGRRKGRATPASRVVSPEILPGKKVTFRLRGA